VIVFTDPPQSLAAAVARRLGLSFHHPETARQLSDKLQQRVALRARGIPVPRFATFRPSTVLDAQSDVEPDVAFPAVLKPQQGAGSRDTFLVHNRAELRAALEACRDEDFILEQYLEDRVDPASWLGAQMVSVETVFPGGVAHHLAITGRFPLAYPFRETGSFLPSDLSPDEIQPVLALASAAASALTVRHGVLHTEIKITPTGPRVIEVNGRIGGGVPGLLARVGGPPLLVWAIRLALSLDVGPIADLPSSPVAYFRWILAPAYARTLRQVRGLDEVRALPGVNGLHLNRQPGDRLDAREGGTFGHVVALHGRVADHQALGALLAAVESKLQLTYT
jgi:biotin carboxylase